MSILDADADGEIETSEDTLVPTGKSLIEALDDRGLVLQPAGFGKKVAVAACAATLIGTHTHGLPRRFH